MMNDAVTPIADTAPQWLGEWPVNYGYWIDHALLLVKAIPLSDHCHDHHHGHYHHHQQYIVINNITSSINNNNKFIYISPYVYNKYIYNTIYTYTTGIDRK